MLEQNKNKNKLFWLITASFLLVPLIVSVISTIHVINFFELSNHTGLALTLAVAFELGALAALAGLVALDKINKSVVWTIFLILTAYQCFGNTFAAYDWMSIKMLTKPDLIKNWSELFGLINEGPEDLIFTKRIIAIISGAILPIVSLSFLHLSVDYIQKSAPHLLAKSENIISEPIVETVKDIKPIQNEIHEISEEQTIEDSAIEKVLQEKPTIEFPIVEEVTTAIPEEIIPEEIIPEEKLQEHEDFQKFIQEKKKKIEDMREPHLELLEILYNNGTVNVGDEFPTYSEFIKKVDTNKHLQSNINLFLTLCNYLEICKLSGIQRIALKTYDEAYQRLDNYFTIGEEGDL